MTSQMRSQTGSSAVPSGSGRDNGRSDFRIEDNNVQRISPRDRDYLPSNYNPGGFYGKDRHCFGFRVESLPPKYRKIHSFGIDYYMYNNVYYRPYREHYIVCRPPFGVILDAITDIAFSAVRFSYYSNAYRTFNAINENNRYIDQQNRIIAQNNATIAAQNRSIALNTNAASSAYDVASRLGLVQSYAYADRNYYYDDGVFYIINDNGRYQTIVPPAGALVQELPDDYETIVLNGQEYYRVDDTVYRLTLVSGAAYLEVLGQMYGTLAQQYSIY